MKTILKFFTQTFLLGCLCLAFSSCKRLDGETIVEGQVVDRHTGKPVPHAIVGVYVNRSGAIWGGSVLDVEKQADGNGNFSFRFEGDGGKSYLLRAFTNNGGYTLWQEAADIYEGKNNKKIKLKMQSPAWLKIKLTNQLPKDTIWMHLQPLDNGDLGLNMLSADTTIVGLVAGNEARNIVWRITNSRGFETKTVKEIYFPANDTVSLEIDY